MKAPTPRPQFEVGGDDLVFTSGVVSRLLDIPVWVLKQLDKENVVRPPRRKGRSRLYSKNHLKEIEHVWHYMNVRSVNVHGVKVILELEAQIVAAEKKKPR